jgi:two-component system response regulator YesN
LDEIAGALYVNGNYLSRVFKRETGQTLLHYHNAVRCEKAKRLLSDTDLSVSEVSEAVGFVSPAHFPIFSGK